MSDDNKGSVTPRITRTNSVFPASQVTRPFIDPRSGQQIGTRVDPRVGSLPRGSTEREDRQREQEQEERKLQGVTRYQRAVAAQRQAGLISLDGVAVKPNMITTGGVTVNPDGTVTDENGRDITRTARGTLAAQQSKARSVFSALNINDIEPSATFIMSYGKPIDPATGEPVPAREGSDVVNGGTRARLERERQQGPSENRMTIAAGVQWLRRLSVKDPQAYNAMVVQLRNAGYINGQDEDLPLNGYSRVVAEAFAYAATDLANAAEEGETRTLSEWLTVRGQGYADWLAEQEAERAAAEEYKPVERAYTDPAALKAQARAAAEDLLGRTLSDEELARFTGHFKGLEDGMYDQIDAAGRAKGQVTYTNPNAVGQVEEFLQNPEFNEDRAKMQVGGYVDALKSLLMGGG